MNLKEVQDKIFQICPVGMVALDKQGNIAFANQEAEKILGLTRTELSQLTYDSPVWKITDFKGNAFAKEQLPFSLVISSGKAVFDVEHAIECGGGNRVYLSINAAPIYDADHQIGGVIATMQDVTQRILAEERLRESEKRYHNLFNNLIDEVHVWRVIKDEHDAIQSWELVDANASALRSWGKTKEQVVGRNAIELFGEVAISLFKPVVESIFKTKQPYSWEAYFEPTNQYLAMDSIPLGDYFISTGRDVTEKVRVNEDLKKAKEQADLAKDKAEESDRLKTSFLQNLSHEIRTPLNAICGFAQILENPALSLESRKNYTSLMQSSSTQLLSIVSDILVASALEKGQEKVVIKEVNINSIIQDVYFLFNNKAKAKRLVFKVRSGMPDDKAFVATDETKVRQIITNLLGNALKFTHEGEIVFGYSVEENAIQFYITDTGIGIKPELHEIIFERFRQADPGIAIQYGGNGLGLSISKEYVHLLGGKIWVNSEPGKGSTFYFTIPYRPVRKTGLMDQHAPYTILVAEDEALNYMVIEGMLMNQHAKLIHAKDGQEAVNLFSQNPDINLVLMDIKMPRLTGDLAARAIKAMNPDVPIIAQSGYAFETELSRYVNIFDDYITKPISENVLIQKISKYASLRDPGAAR